MQYKISDKLISIPPFLSAAWKDVRAVFLSEEDLHVTLLDGTVCVIPQPEHDLIQEIFLHHTQWMERSETEKPKVKRSRGPDLSKEIPLFSFGGAQEGMASAMQHNPQLANAPDIPKETLKKISGIAKVLVPNELHMIPPAEPHCNCPHCQISRAIQNSFEDGLEAQSSETEEPISPQDLSFRTWDIQEMGEKLFLVKNPLDPLEEYRVFLGDPIGCTCGHTKCEHVEAVLNT